MTRFVLATLLAAGLTAPARGQERATVADSAAVMAVVESVRGANPVVCELAARTVENQWGWGMSSNFRAPRDATVRAALDVTHGRRAPDAAVPALAAALRDDDACVRRLAAPLLGRVRTPATLAALRSALRDERPATRQGAATALGFGEDPAAIPALLGGLQDAEPRVRAACAWALGEIEDSRAIGALVRVLREDRDADVRAAAAWALGSIEG